jgi:glycerol kinase
VWDAQHSTPMIHPAIVWQDRRTADHCAEPSVVMSSGGFKPVWLIDPHFSATVALDR